MKLKDRFSGLPIQSKLSFINVIAVMVALLPVVAITLGYEYYSIRRSIVAEAEVQASIIRDNIVAATAFSDAAAAGEILHALRASPHVRQGAVFLPDGTVLAQYLAPTEGTKPPPNPVFPDATSDLGGSIVVSRAVRLKQDIVGALVIETSTAPLRDRLTVYLLVVLFSTAVGVAIAWRLSKWLKESITGPLSELLALANYVSEHQDYPPPRQGDYGSDEIGKLSHAFDDMLSGIRRRDLKLSQMAYYDNVTGLANRHYFMERLHQAVASTSRYGTRCCLMFIDLDNFKTVNDTHGHDVGDALLREVARRLTQVSRNNDFVCRIGGDEFAVIVDGVTDLSGPSVLAGKIVDALCSPEVIDGKELVIGASIGLAGCPEHANTVDELLRTADCAMYRAKTEGKNGFRIYSPDMSDTPPPREATRP
ncbi:diguanylate cyclase [Denitromonas iodatirespirans]|uniref:Diguanylate cyclase n=1 Tax=Denitromonas iodatirespirans TaxID=2795389 RepID=A0A944DD62_DENI1|nr:diguanylate cyclase [Denitromonas iodatirespirans]MBT0963297.1 diguanylate cyclase [Denitromonas iodatirespirans]